MTKIFSEMADMLEILGENRFRVNAYRRAAEAVEEAAHDLATFSKKQLMGISGIGNDLSDKILEIGKTGKCKEHERLKKKVPRGLLDVLTVEGMGPKTTAFVWKKFGVKSFANFETLLESGKLEKALGFGEKKVANIKRGVATYKKIDRHHPLEDAAESVAIPHGLTLIEEKDIRGNLHTHSSWSDGKKTIETVVREAKRRGYAYIAMTDHASSMGMVRGIKTNTIEEYIREIRSTEKRIGGIHILAGAEVDIEKNGALYLPDAALKKFDFVIAAIHSNMKQDRATATKRVLHAIKNPYVHCIGHLTTRIIGKRPPMDFDMEAIMKAARRPAQGKHQPVMMELNAHWARLDLSDVHCRLAKEYGIPIAISTDAHSIEDFDMMRHGIAIARRGSLEKKDVVNARPWKELQNMLKK